MKRYRISFVDLVLGLLAPFVAFLARDPGYFGRDDAWGAYAYVALAALITPIASMLFKVGHIVPRYLARRDVKRILKAAAAAVIVTSLATFLLNRLDGIPRSLPLLHLVVLAGLLLGTRYLIGGVERRIVTSGAKRHAASGQDFLVVGANDVAFHFLRMLNAFHSARRARVVGILDDNPKLRGRSVAGYPVLGTMAQADQVIRELKTHGVFVDRIILSLADLDAQARAEHLLAGVCKQHGVMMENLATTLLASPPNFMEARALDEASIAPYLRLRAVVDRLAACLALAVLSPLIAIAALLVWLDVGSPVIFWQKRVGKHGREILVHKFRTLKPPVGPSGEVLAAEERLSALGRFLRRTRLDELPQLYDILRGHMGAIGPRPLLPEDIVEGAAVRHAIAPGITGWAQVFGGNLVTDAEKNALDEWYVRNATPLADLKIVLETIRVVTRGERRNETVIAQAVNAQGRGASQMTGWTRTASPAPAFAQLARRGGRHDRDCGVSAPSASARGDRTGS